MDPTVAVALGLGPRIRAVISMTVHTLDSVPLPLIFLLLLACVWLSMGPNARNAPLLPTHSYRSAVFDPALPKLVLLPQSTQGRYVYLETRSRNLVVSASPLDGAVVRSGKTRKPPAKLGLRSCRWPLGVVAEEEELAEVHPIVELDAGDHVMAAE